MASEDQQLFAQEGNKSFPSSSFLSNQAKRLKPMPHKSPVCTAFFQPTLS